MDHLTPAVALLCTVSKQKNTLSLLWKVLSAVLAACSQEEVGFRDNFFSLVGSHQGTTHRSVDCCRARYCIMSRKGFDLQIRFYVHLQPNGRRDQRH